ncbi:MAG: hypothetical protein NTV34_08075 [Proteobacteria bacterium]|nr:hypothetical protein [Pseudomonadota bacterium]
MSTQFIQHKVGLIAYLYKLFGHYLGGCMRLALKFQFRLHVPAHALCLAIFAALALPACKNRERSKESSLNDSTAIQSMNRVGDDFDISCIDGSRQVVPILEFPTKPSSAICPDVKATDCPSQILYSNQRELRSARGDYNYPDGSPLLLKDLQFRYFGGRPLANGSEGLLFPDGSNLYLPSQGFFFPDGKLFKAKTGYVYYPSGRVFFTSDGFSIKYPDDKFLRDTNGNFYYTKKNGSQLLRTSSTFYYTDGLVARSGGNIYRESDRRVSNLPLIIREDIADATSSFGYVQFNVSAQSDSYFIDLPNLAPGMIARYQSSTKNWFIRYQFVNLMAPLQITFDGDNQSMVFFLKTGYRGQTVMVDFSHAPANCKVVTAISK